MAEPKEPEPVTQSQNQPAQAKEELPARHPEIVVLDDLPARQPERLTETKIPDDLKKDY
jgi:hypothetical protein